MERKEYMCNVGHKSSEHRVNYVTKKRECHHAHCNAPITGEFTYTKEYGWLYESDVHRAIQKQREENENVA